MYTRHGKPFNLHQCSWLLFNCSSLNTIFIRLLRLALQLMHPKIATVRKACQRDDLSVGSGSKARKRRRKRTVLLNS